MARVYEQAFFGDTLVPMNEASLSIASSAVLYGLSVYTVFPVCTTSRGLAAFRLKEHYRRLANSCRIIGIDTFAPAWTEEKFAEAARQVVAANAIQEDVFVRATVHITNLVPGTRSRGLAAALSIFIYEASPIVPQAGARLKTSMWRRNPDVSIPSRAKVNGGYINSVLAKQDALDSGYDDCILLDAENHVCELSAANIFIVRGDSLFTPGSSSDILEGINRKTIIELARDMQIRVEEHTIDVSELYIADEVFACGTSAFVAPVIEIDRRAVGTGAMGPLTKKLREKHCEVLHGQDPAYQDFLTLLS
jgi:branched-chain amino acid aminotransferase